MFDIIRKNPKVIERVFLILAGAMVYVCLHELLVESMEQLGVIKAFLVLSSDFFLVESLVKINEKHSIW